MRLVFLICLLLGLFGCEVVSSTNQRPSLDVKLIGVWSGEYLGKGSTSKSFVESGRWWIQGGLFHEITLFETA